ncbi:MAG TPA: hypothetical protein VGZ00_03855 [Candidatus Baltobacteraceae bacterium]|jgi:hypothetical protein|nr:hypothetical protein [Candidatus Baltobacteraceae bacterium]
MEHIVPRVAEALTVVGSFSGFLEGAVALRELFKEHGIGPHKNMVPDPLSWGKDLWRIDDVDQLLKKLATPEAASFPLRDPQRVSIRGTLYPCGLLSSGWWAPRAKAAPNLKGSDLQSWLYYGFSQWGPSWDFSWNFDQNLKTQNDAYCVAQLGTGDESNSIPVRIPIERAKQLLNDFREKGSELGIDDSEVDVSFSGLRVEITGFLYHRRHCPKAAHGAFGDSLDYSIWIREDQPDDDITILTDEPDFYSGYLWKCCVPEADLQRERITRDQAFFIWTHTNLVKGETIKYELDSLRHKEEYISKQHGNLVLLQKSSELIKGTPVLPKNEFFEFYQGKGKTISSPP